MTAVFLTSVMPSASWAVLSADDASLDLAHRIFRERGCRSIFVGGQGVPEPTTLNLLSCLIFLDSPRALSSPRLRESRWKV
jgi:hypothetical protein